MNLKKVLCSGVDVVVPLRLFFWPRHTKLFQSAVFNFNKKLTVLLFDKESFSITASLFSNDAHNDN